jgi:hypothetical protein
MDPRHWCDSEVLWRRGAIQGAGCLRARVPLSMVHLSHRSRGCRAFGGWLTGHSARIGVAPTAEALLIVDNARPHADPGALRVFRANSVRVITVPPHCTHLLHLSMLSGRSLSRTASPLSCVPRPGRPLRQSQLRGCDDNLGSDERSVLRSSCLRRMPVGIQPLASGASRPSACLAGTSRVHALCAGSRRFAAATTTPRGRSV